ncbi:TAXI family TRAP transporter solute-binding subunit [Rhodovastum atsumiense]|uniref:TAXI family TRAP transporter solute-binding subunit n=2 Tax=Rhodovastum atsumiense TaxID=504468 RepID=A0A5M6IR74_9PROT|nr:TAXI family TRAP transporter solute-binding subunit [Rhodovastum atsumiense]
MGMLLLLATAGIAARAQGNGDAAARANAEAVARANAGTVGVIAGGVDGTYIRIAADLSAVLDDGEKLRVLALIGKGSVQNLSDIIYLKGVDIGIVQSDVLAFARKQRLFPGVEQAVQYIAKLYDEEVHILAGPDIARIEDLAGKPVNVDVRGSGTAMTASVLFEGLGIAPKFTNDSQADALEKLRRGDIAALVYVTGKPARLFSGLDGAEGLHLLAVPLTPTLLETYLPARFAHADYPGLLGEQEAVDTIAVGSVMAAFAWSPGSDRYRKVARFVDAFFGNFPAFQQKPRHPKWRDVNLAAQAPGWTRFPAAQEWLQRQTVAGGPDERASFDAFLVSTGGTPAGLNETQRALLFQQFLAWRKRQGL